MSSQTSTDSALLDELDKATKLEAQLKCLIASDVNTESKASEIRIKLCEVFSDVLLTDCTTALRKDVTSRLWYSCFYNRIQELRQRLAKEKSRARKQSTNSDIDDAGKTRIKIAEQSLTNFIQEGITLYNFLVDRLQGSLLPPEETQSQSQFSENSQPYSKGTVPALHKLYIHLGDMHRYASSFSDAENAYLQASKLAPSKGNPYNQLAVVAQLKETNGYPLPAMALYWYCRSLSSYEVFETSKGNIERLFVANEKWLMNNGSSFNFSSPKLQEALQGANKEEARQIKGTASRMVLSRFVSFHGHLYQKKVDNLEEDLLIQRYREILDVNPFGDGLMIKLVVINVFSVWNAKRNPNVFSTAFQFIIKFTSHLCQSMESILDKAQAKVEKTGKVTNLRLLGPLLLACEFISQEISCEDNLEQVLKTDECCERQLEDFWKNIGKLSSNMSKLQGLCPDLKAQSDALLSIPEDFKSLSMGCKPFSFLDSTKAQTSHWAYVDQHEAIEALELRVSQTQSQVTQRSKKLGISTDNCDAETRIKYQRFMAIVQKHIQSGDLIETCEGTIEPASLVPNNPKNKEQKIDSANIIEKPSSGDKVMELSTVPSYDKDVLVYKQSREGQQALLVPSELLTGEPVQNEDVTMDDGSDLLKLSDIIDKNMKEKAEQIIPPDQLDKNHGNGHEEEQTFQPNISSLPTVRPPPGFHTSNAVPEPLPIQSSSQSLGIPSVDNLVTNQNPNFGLLQHHTYGGLSSLVDPPSQSTLQNPQVQHSMFQSSLPLHTLPETRNPFVSRLTQSYGVDTSIDNTSGSTIAPTLVGHELLPDLDNVDDRNLHEHDPFGLRALGIFSPNEKSMVNDRNNFGTNFETRNPFYLG
jgi:Telomerase activating protein Est1.